MNNLNLLEKNENLTNFYFFRRCLKNEEIENLKKISDNYPTIDGNVSGQIVESYRKSKIKWLPYNDETQEIYDKLINLAKKANNEMWKFHITNVIDQLQYTEYRSEEDGHYDWHMDIGGYSSSTRKLSMVVQLTNPEEYEGGKLQFMINRQIIDAPVEKGTVIFFPTYLLHRVTKIESGLRNSLVCWFHGPPFV